ncbi:hypothetical protein L2U69_04355 [Zavarzinia compransoris]|uniref:hypothetical protein n=1 Tax=Zavarzinia marina TaxID=2911065 RepID=UPI001F2EF1DA|nr:hypothetical protein [Zavarzinia marina]MCF4164870.1 hypothetical protein [Zavarzinia marina]
MPIVLAVLAPVAALIALLAPALWNGFPISFHDTGGYFAAPYIDAPGNGRSTVYGLFLEALHGGAAFWPAIVVQCAMVVALLVETGRAFLGLRGRALALFAGAMGVGLSLVSGLAWYAAQLMPDIWASAAVLALILMIEGREGRGLAAWAGLALVVAFGAASHTGTMALVLGLLLFKGLLMVVARLHEPLRQWRRRASLRLGIGGLALALGVLAVPMANLATYGQFRFTPGGDVFLFGRLVQDGIASRYLADHCPDPSLKLCDHQAELFEDDGTQRSNDSFLWWGGSPLYEIGGWDEAGPELARITRESLVEYPAMHAAAAWRSFVRQLGLIGTGDGLNEHHWHTQYVFEKYRPDDLPAYMAAEQRGEDIPFGVMNIVHVPLGFLAIGLLPVSVAVFLWGRRASGPGRLAAFVLVALLGNAAICGILSNPHDRYQNRLVWLALLSAGVSAVALTRRPELTKNQSD